MKKKIVFIIIYIAVCLVPLCTVFLAQDTSSAEKRELSAFPKLTNEKGVINTAFFNEFDAWFSDHMGGRSFLVAAQAAMKEKVFFESAESSVILGADGWLFYEKTADDFCNVRTYTERNVENVARTLLMVQEYCKSNGAEFVFTVAPNKNTLYADKMPFRYLKVQGKSNLDVLADALNRYGVNYADLKAAFLAENRVLYQARDSHWTYEGGMLAYRTILGRLSGKHSLLEEVTFTERADWDADLVNMVYPNAPDNDIQVYPDIEYTFITKGDVVSDEALVIETMNGAGEGQLLMFRDSFGNTTWRYFAEGFSAAEFQRSVPYRINAIERLSADTVILEIVERNLINLAEKAPMMPAPARELSLTDAYDMASSRTKIVTEPSGSYLHVYGMIDPRYLGSKYRAFVVADGESGREFYEAFPIYERELLKTEHGSDNGFSCYLPDSVSEEALRGILVETEGKYFYAAMK